MTRKAWRCPSENLQLILLRAIVLKRKQASMQQCQQSACNGSFCSRGAFRHVWDTCMQQILRQTRLQEPRCQKMRRCPLCDKLSIKLSRWRIRRKRTAWPQMQITAQRIVDHAYHAEDSHCIRTSSGWKRMWLTKSFVLTTWRHLCRAWHLDVARSSLDIWSSFCEALHVQM